MSTVHVYAPAAEQAKLQNVECNTCGPDATFYSRFYEWHGWGHVCLRCGERFEGGYQLDRPFYSQWREDSIRSARADAAYRGIALPPLERVRGYRNWKTRTPVAEWMDVE